jgi:hypothetical protein
MTHTEEQIQEYLKLIKENAEIISGYGYGYGFPAPSGAGGQFIKKIDTFAESEESISNDEDLAETLSNDEDLAETFREIDREIEEDSGTLFPLDYPDICCAIT